MNSFVPNLIDCEFCTVCNDLIQNFIEKAHKFDNKFTFCDKKLPQTYIVFTNGAYFIIYCTLS